jgi:hypothetical protein
MKIAVCIKQVPDSWAEKKMVGGLLDRANVDAVLNDLDEYAVEEALRIAEAHVEMKKVAQTPSQLFQWDQSVRQRLLVRPYQWVQMMRFSLAIQS